MPKLVNFKKWELLLLIFSALVFILSAALYVSGVSLRKTFLGWEDGSNREKIGAVGTVVGNVRRQGITQTEFVSAPSASPLFNLDTVVTGPDSKAVLNLDGGAMIELAPSTMIKLQFESSFGIDKIVRGKSAQVEIITGNVKGQSIRAPLILKTNKQVIRVEKESAKTVSAVVEKINYQPVVPVTTIPPTTIPTPTTFVLETTTSTTTTSTTTTIVPVTTTTQSVVTLNLKSPKTQANYTVENYSEQAKKNVEFSWKVLPPSVALKLIVQKLGSTNKEEKTYSKIIDPNPDGNATTQVVLDKPGSYRWEFLTKDGATPQGKGVQGSFSIKSEFEGIQLEPPLVAGKALSSNTYDDEALDNFEITFQWKKYEGAKKYVLELLKNPQDKTPLTKKETTQTQINLNREKIYSGLIYFRVYSELPSGFKVTSKKEPFSFTFLPPILVMPENQAKLTRAMLDENNKTLLMTWQKTNFTENYEIEIAKDSAFKKIIVSQKTKVNFYVFKNPASGTYFWRIRSIASSYSSPQSRVSQFSVQ